MAGLIPKEYEEFMLIIDRALAEDILRHAKSIISNEKKLSRVFEKYAEAEIPKEVAKADVAAVNALAKALLT